MQVNITGVMQCMRAQIRQMNNKGSIVNAASIAGLGGFPKNAAYTVAKHGVIGITKTVAKEVGDRSIRVNCIAPGIIDTDMHRESVRIRGKEGDYKIQIPRKGRPEEVAALIVWLMCDGSQYITGTVQIIVSVGWCIKMSHTVGGGFILPSLFSRSLFRTVFFNANTELLQDGGIMA